jgi:hypothetical protein
MLVRATIIVTILLWCALTSGLARGGISLEFYRGTSQNDTTLNLAQPINAGNPLIVNPIPGPTSGAGIDAFVQVALRQTAPTTLLDAGDGLAAFLVQGVFDGSGSYFIPATSGVAGTVPIVNVANQGTYSLVRSYRTGPGGNTAGGNQTTATAFRFGGLNLNPPPSPSVDANGRIFLGTFAIEGNNLGAVPVNATITLQDPNPAPATIDNITDMGDNIDAVLFNGATYPVPMIVNPVPEPAAVWFVEILALVALRRQPSARGKQESS